MANIKLLLDVSHSKKKDLAEYMGKVPQSLSKMLQNKQTWFFEDMCNAADFFHVGIETLVRTDLTPFTAELHDATVAEMLMIRLGAEAGLRLSEIAAVHSRDVLDGDAGPSLIVRGKGDRQRMAEAGRGRSTDNGRMRLGVPRSVDGTRRKIVCVPPHQPCTAVRMGAA